MRKIRVQRGILEVDVADAVDTVFSQTLLNVIFTGRNVPSLTTHKYNVLTM